MSFLPWVVAAWLAGASALWLRLLSGWILAERLRIRLVRPAPQEWRQAFERLKNRMRIPGDVRLLVSSLVESPAVVGWLRPVVLVPVGALAGLPADQVEALLLHELAHIRRQDYLVNGLQGLVETLLFYHPAVWWISGHIRAERELCCDDATVSVTGDALAYAMALSELESTRQAWPRPAMAAAGGFLAHRVARLLGQSRSAPRTFSGPGIAAAALLMAATGIAVFGQPAVLPAFEAASIKPSESRGLQMVRPLPGRLTADAGLRLIILNAYGVQAYQLAGGPDWLDRERYHIEAKAAANVGREQIFLMLQSLLADRFHLKVHRETKEMPVYDLVPARAGVKLPAVQSGACEAPAPDSPPDWSIGRMLPPGQGPPHLPKCGSVSVGLESGGVAMKGGNVGMAELTRALSLSLDRTVIDKTGYKGAFDVRLVFQADESTPVLPPPPPGGNFHPEMASLPAALQEQLGLRLEKVRGPVDVLVIDHVEPPSGN